MSFVPSGLNNVSGSFGVSCSGVLGVLVGGGGVGASGLACANDETLACSPIYEDMCFLGKRKECTSSSVCWREISC